MPDEQDSQAIALRALLEGLACIPALRAEIAELRGKVAVLEGKAGRERKQWYTLEEAAKALKSCPRKVRYHIENGLLSKNLASRKILIPAADIENFAGAVTRKKR